MKDFLEKKDTVLEFKKQYFNEEDENRGYPSGNAEDLEKKLSNKELFEKNISLLHQLEEQINALEFSRKYWQQRDKDLDKNKASGYSDNYGNKIQQLIGFEKKFREKCYNYLYENAWSSNCLNILKEYEQGAKDLNIRGEMFFMGIWNFIDEYIREYTPSDAVYFNPEMDVDEKTLREKIQAAFDILERNKERWRNEENESIKI